MSSNRLDSVNSKISTVLCIDFSTTQTIDYTFASRAGKIEKDPWSNESHLSLDMKSHLKLHMKGQF